MGCASLFLRDRDLHGEREKSEMLNSVQQPRGLQAKCVVLLAWL